MEGKRVVVDRAEMRRAAGVRLVASMAAIVAIVLTVSSLGGSSALGFRRFPQILDPAVTSVIFQFLPWSLELIAVSFTVASLVGFGIARLSVRAVRPVVQGLMLALRCIPLFVLVIAAQITSLAKLPNAVGEGGAGSGLADHLVHLILPATVLALFQLPALVKYFIESSKGGLAGIFATTLPGVISATLITEALIAWPGEGRLLWTSFAYSQHDWDLNAAPTTAAILLFSALLVLAVRFVAGTSARAEATDLRKVLRRLPLLMGLGALCVVFALSYSGPIRSAAIAIDEANWSGNPLPPSFAGGGHSGGHVLGTDENGRDLLARLVVGARVSLVASLAVAILTLAVGFALGALARCGGALTNYAVLRLAEALACIPVWPFVLATVLFTVPHRTISVMAVTAIATALLFSWRTMREVAAANDLHGAVANVLGAVPESWVDILFLFAMIDFAGFGVQPPTPSLGNSLVNALSDYWIAWWAPVFPAVCLVVAALAIEFTHGPTRPETIRLS